MGRICFSPTNELNSKSVVFLTYVVCFSWYIYVYIYIHIMCSSLCFFSIIQYLFTCLFLPIFKKFKPNTSSASPNHREQCCVKKSPKRITRGEGLITTLGTCLAMRGGSLGDFRGPKTSYKHLPFDGQPWQTWVPNLQTFKILTSLNPGYLNFKDHFPDGWLGVWQLFQVPKRQVLNLMFGEFFGGWVFPYISRIHTAYIGEDSSILGNYLKCLVKGLMRVNWVICWVGC